MSLDKPIVISEFPKSGASWISSMVGDALGIAKRDIYMTPGFKLFDTTRHPWYRDADALDFPAQSVIKSHELPNSTLIGFDATYVHLVRDGRDVVVSKFFFDRDFCVKNGITQSFDKSFDQYVEETAREWSNYVTHWADQPVETLRYEHFLADPLEALQRLLERIAHPVPERARLADAVSRNTRERFAASLDELFEHNTFVRKGIAGDWKNHFSAANIESFKSGAGAALLRLGYETHADW